MDDFWSDGYRMNFDEDEFYPDQLKVALADAVVMSIFFMRLGSTMILDFRTAEGVNPAVMVDRMSRRRESGCCRFAVASGVADSRGNHARSMGRAGAGVRASRRAGAATRAVRRGWGRRADAAGARRLLETCWPRRRRFSVTWSAASAWRRSGSARRPGSRRSSGRWRA